MKYFPRITTILLSSLVIIVTASIFIYAAHSAKAGSELVRYFARLGIALDYTTMIIVAGLIPVFWLVAFIVKILSLKWK